MKNQDNWDFALSSTHIKEVCNISKQAYDDGITELIEKGYLVPIDKSKNRWMCYELPERYKEQAAALDYESEEFQF